jgi:hypothetical protein
MPYYRAVINRTLPGWILASDEDDAREQARAVWESQPGAADVPDPEIEIIFLGDYLTHPPTKGVNDPHGQDA